jgi:hypothetical protein
MVSSAQEQVRLARRQIETLYKGQKPFSFSNMYTPLNLLARATFSEGIGTVRAGGRWNVCNIMRLFKMQTRFG